MSEVTVRASPLVAAAMLLSAVSWPCQAQDGFAKILQLARPVRSGLHDSKKSNDGIEAAVTCFKTGEQVSGMNKICYYDCMGSAAAITISAVSLCPLSIQQRWIFSAAPP